MGTGIAFRKSATIFPHRFNNHSYRVYSQIPSSPEAHCHNYEDRSINTIYGLTDEEFIFWDITSCSPFEVNRRFGGTCGFSFQVK
jgi:hypothetical protein